MQVQPNLIPPMWKRTRLWPSSLTFFFSYPFSPPRTQYAMYHANQGLTLFLAGIAVSIIGSIPIIGWFLILPIGSLVVLVIGIIGILNAIKGEAKPLPLIGKFTLLK